ncbi:hypothetical protein [Actinokineospora sp. NPDC004072]
MLALLGPDEAVAWEVHGNDLMFSRSDGDDIDAMAQACATVLRDPDRSGGVRFSAFRGLVNLGPRFHRAAVDGLRDLLLGRSVPASYLPLVSSAASSLGRAGRAEIADLLVEVATGATASTVCYAAKAVAELDPADDRLRPALRDVLDDDSLAAAEHLQAGLLLAEATPGGVAEALVRGAHEAVYGWVNQTRSVVYNGLIGQIRSLMRDSDVPHYVRRTCAAIVANTCSEPEAVAELVEQAKDQFLGASWGIDVFAELAALGAADTVRLRAMVADESLPAADRAEAGYWLGRFEPSSSPLSALVDDPTNTSEERERILRWMSALRAVDPAHLNRMRVALLGDPRLPAVARRMLTRVLVGAAGIEAHRELLADASVPLSMRVAGLSEWDGQRLARVAEAVLREAMGAAEYLPGERIDAAVLLAQLFPRHATEVARFLADAQPTGKARVALAGLGQTHRRRVLDELYRVIGDAAAAWRDRTAAVDQLVEISTLAPAAAVDGLRALCADQRISGLRLMKIRLALRAVDGIDPIRRMLDHPRPATRVWAAQVLREYAVADRRAAARVLREVARGGSRPALRLRAAKDLMVLGERGREWGADALRTLLDDDTIPLLTRAQAARSLAWHRPDLRGELVRALRKLPAPPTGAGVQVLTCLADFEPYEGAAALADLAGNRALRPGVRLRAAAEMARVHRGYREQAAITAREIAHDSAAPQHIRTKAARALARWSALCRDEARSLLAEVDC